MNELRDTREEVYLDAIKEVARLGIGDESDIAAGCLHPADSDIDGTTAVCVEVMARALKSEAVNREQKAEIERLTDVIASTKESWTFANEEEVVELRAELASLRASGGEKWIDVKQELPPENQYVLAANTFNNRSDLITQHVVFWEADRDWFWFNEDARWGRAAFGFWMPLPAPPTLPGEEK